MEEVLIKEIHIGWQRDCGQRGERRTLDWFSQTGNYSHFGPLQLVRIPNQLRDKTRFTVLTVRSMRVLFCFLDNAPDLTGFGFVLKGCHEVQLCFYPLLTMSAQPFDCTIAGGWFAQVLAEISPGSSSLRGRHADLMSFCCNGVICWQPKLDKEKFIEPDGQLPLVCVDETWSKESCHFSNQNSLAFRSKFFTRKGPFTVLSTNECWASSGWAERAASVTLGSLQTKHKWHGKKPRILPAFQRWWPSFFCCFPEKESPEMVASKIPSSFPQPRIVIVISSDKQLVMFFQRKGPHIRCKQGAMFHRLCSVALRFQVIFPECGKNRKAIWRRRCPMRMWHQLATEANTATWDVQFCSVKSLAAGFWAASH